MAYTKIIRQLGGHYKVRCAHLIMTSQLPYNFCICQKREYNFILYCTVSMYRPYNIKLYSSFYSDFSRCGSSVKSFSRLLNFRREAPAIKSNRVRSTRLYVKFSLTWFSIGKVLKVYREFGGIFSLLSF